MCVCAVPGLCIVSFSLSLCFFVPSRAVSSAQVEVHMTSNKGNIAAECEILKTPVFTSIFHVFWLSTTLRLKQCYMFPVLRLRWPNLVRSCRQKVPSCGMLDLILDLDFQADGFNLYLVRFGPNAAWGPLGVWAQCHIGFDGHVAHIGLVLGPTSAPYASTQDQVAHAEPNLNPKLGSSWAQVGANWSEFGGSYAQVRPKRAPLQPT